MKKILAIAGMLMAAAVLSHAEPDLAVLPAGLRGAVILPDGQTPVSKVNVRVWNSDSEKVIYKTKTNKDGIFYIPKPPAGYHFVTVGSVLIDLSVLSARAGVVPQAHGIIIVMPKRQPVIPVLIPASVVPMTLPRIMSP